jgi:hypothetical protein
MSLCSLQYFSSQSFVMIGIFVSEMSDLSTLYILTEISWHSSHVVRRELIESML